MKYSICLVLTRADYGGNAITERQHYQVIPGETVEELVKRVLRDAISRGHYGDVMEIQVIKEHS